MPTKYVRTAGGDVNVAATWSLSSGGPADTTIPTAADDVVLDANSGDLNTNAAMVCRSFDCNGYTGTMSNNGNISVGDATAGAGNIAIRLVAGMNYTHTGSWILSSTSAIQQTIDFAGKTIAGLTIGSAGGSTAASWLLASVIVATTNVVHQRGAFATDNFDITAAAFNSSNNSVRSQDLGSSTITASNSSVNAINYMDTTNLTMAANTATFVVASAGTAGANIAAFDFNGASLTFAPTGSGLCSITGAGFTIANLTYIGPVNKTNTLSLSGDFTTTGTLTCTGNSPTNRILVFSSTNGTARTINLAGATVHNTNVDFMDIAFVGSPTIATTSSVGDALGNSGITFTTPVDRYAVVAGSWSSTAVWAETSGGAAGASVPLCHDDVYFDANSAAGTYTTDMPRAGADIDFTGFTRTFNINLGIQIFGSLTYYSGMTISNNGGLTFVGRSNHTITSAGKTHPGMLTITAPGGTYILTDALTCSRNGTFNINTASTFDDGGFAVTWSTANSMQVYPNNGSTLIASGLWTFNTTTAATIWRASPTATLTMTGSTILIANSSTNTRIFEGGGHTYGTLTYTVAGSIGRLDIDDAGTSFHTLNFSDSSNARTLNLPTTSGITITDNFNVQGSPAGNMTVTGDVTKTSGTVSCDYLSLSSSDATGGATFYAGANSIDGGSNTGWIFANPPTGHSFGYVIS